MTTAQTNSNTGLSKGRLVSSLQSKLNGGREPVREVVVDYDTSNLIIIPQMRTAFDEDALTQLGQQMSFFQLHPITVRRCSEWQFKEHLRIANNLFPEHNLRPSNYKDKRNSDGTFDVLVAGERRVRAWQTRPDWDKRLFANVCTNISAACAFFLQQVENTAKIPEREEEARMVGRLYKLMKDKGHTPTKVELAMLINRSPSYTSNLIRFYGLPDFILEYYDYGALNYSTAIEFGRLENLYSEEKIISEIKHVFATKMKTDRARKYIGSLIEAKANPGMFGDAIDLQAERMRGQRKKRTVQVELIAAMQRDRKYIDTLNKLLKAGKIAFKDNVDAPFASGSPVNQVQYLAIDLHNLIPSIKALMSSSASEKLEKNEQKALQEIITLVDAA